TASAQQPERTDYLRIVLKNGSPADANRAAVAKIVQSLSAVATRNHLTQDSPTETGDVLQFKFRHAGVPAVEIEIVTRAAARPEVAAMVDRFLQNVPDAAGVNNHQGSQATADAALMDELMPVLRDRHLFYLDSRTTAATVAYDTAQDFGVRSAFRNVPFLDDVTQVAAVRKQLELSLRGAREKGEALAIGHPHPATL